MPKRRLNGEGSFSQRADGTWKCQVTIEDALKRKTRKSLYAKTLPECKQKLEEFKAKIEEDKKAFFVDLEQGKTTMSLWGEEFLKECKQRVNNNSLKQNTFVKYETFFRYHIKPRLGHFNLDEITPRTVDNFHIDLARETKKKAKLSAHSIRDISAFLGLLLNQAVSEGLIPVSPMTKCKKSLLPGKESPKLKMLDNKDISSFLGAIKGDPLENLFRFALFEGLRLGELLGLTWDCWDPEKGTLRIYRQLQYDRNKKAYQFEQLKTKQSNRLLSLPASMGVVLEGQRKRQAELRLKAGPLWDNADNLIFTNDFGGHLCHNTVRKHIKAIYAEIGTPESRFHDMRHTYTALCIEGGDDVSNIQNNLGHSTPITTLAIYSYLTQNAKKASAERMEQTIQRLG